LKVVIDAGGRGGRFGVESQAARTATAEAAVKRNKRIGGRLARE
jgi:hypothetical protein